MIDYDNIISELGRELGTELAFNDEDMCEMAIGDSFVLSIERRTRRRSAPAPTAPRKGR